MTNTGYPCSSVPLHAPNDLEKVQEQVDDVKVPATNQQLGLTAGGAIPWMHMCSAEYLLSTIGLRRQTHSVTLAQIQSSSENPARGDKKRSAPQQHGSFGSNRLLCSVLMPLTRVRHAAEQKFRPPQTRSRLQAAKGVETHVQAAGRCRRLCKPRRAWRPGGRRSSAPRAPAGRTSG